VPCSFRERLTDRLEIVARVEPFRDRDRFAERLAVAQKRGAREHVDLRAASLM
jgi:hypothetical protein